MKNFVQRYRHFETQHKGLTWGLFIGLLVFAFLYFLPVWAPFLSQEQQAEWMAFNYNLFNPFFVAPVIIGVLSLCVQMGTGPAWQKALAACIFGFAFIWSLIGIMGIAEPIQLLKYLPHLILVVLHIVVWIFGTKKKLH